MQVTQLPTKFENPHEGWLRISNDNFIDAKRYPNVVDGSSKLQDAVILMDLEELNSLPPALNRAGQFRKNSNFVEGTTPTLDSFYFWLKGDSIWYSEK